MQFPIRKYSWITYGGQDNEKMITKIQLEGLVWRNESLSIKFRSWVLPTQKESNSYANIILREKLQTI